MILQVTPALLPPRLCLPWRKQGMVNDSCQPQPARSTAQGQTLCEGAEMPCFGCWGIDLLTGPPSVQWKGQLPKQQEQIPHIQSAVFYSLSHPQGTELFQTGYSGLWRHTGKQGMSDGCLHEVGAARWLLERKKEELVLSGKV